MPLWAQDAHIPVDATIDWIGRTKRFPHFLHTHSCSLAEPAIRFVARLGFASWLAILGWVVARSVFPRTGWRPE